MIIQSTRVWLDDRFIPAQLEVRGEKIVRIGEYKEQPADFDYGRDRIIPGMIDVHTHGAYGFDTNDGDEAGLRNWAARLPVEEGVTAFQPSTITQSPEILNRALKNVADVVDSGYQGAEILGIHFEGPYIDRGKGGAQPVQFILDADVEQFIGYQKTARGLIHYITLAPEHDRDLKLTRWCSEHGIVVSLGHTNGTYEDALKARQAGARSMTHVYNAMSGFSHRQPGMVGAALRLRDMYGELICDGIHSSPEALNIMFQAKNPGRIVMITDSLRAKGLPPGEYLSGGRRIKLDADGCARLIPEGILAGSTLKMNRGLQVLIEKAEIPEALAINAATANPARLLGVDGRKGSLTPGHDGDIVVLADDYAIVQTFVRGQKYHI